MCVHVVCGVVWVVCVHVVLCVVCTCGVWCWCCVYMWCCVLCVHVVCGVGGACGGAYGVVWCVVLVVRVVLCVHVVLCVVKLGTRKTPRVYVQNASVCTVRTSPCVPATGPHVQDMRACCRYTRRRPDRTHGGVLNGHTGGFLFSLFSSLFLSLCCSLSFFLSSSLSSSLSLSFTAHTETRSDRQVTLPTKNGHAPRDPLNQERAINLSILAMSQPGKFWRVKSN